VCVSYRLFILHHVEEVSKRLICIPQLRYFSLERGTLRRRELLLAENESSHAHIALWVIEENRRNGHPFEPQNSSPVKE